MNNSQSDILTFFTNGTVSRNIAMAENGKPSRALMDLLGVATADELIDVLSEWLGKADKENE